MKRRVLLLALITLAVACASGRAPSPGGKAARVLFVGNSLIYVGNAPAVYSALAAANGRPTQSDMIVRGGATLAQRVADGSVEQAVSQGGYTALVIQERGGDLICAFGPESCVESRAAVKELATIGRAHGLEVVLLGSHQPHPAASRRIVEKEREAANEAGIPYAEVSERLQRLRDVEPSLVWFAEDGSHPGRDLALLNAIVVFEALHGRAPGAAPLQVAAPIYGITSGLDDKPRRAEDPPPLAETPREISYSSETVERLLRVIADGGS